MRLFWVHVTNCINVITNTVTIFSSYYAILGGEVCMMCLSSFLKGQCIGIEACLSANKHYIMMCCLVHIAI